MTALAYLQYYQNLGDFTLTYKVPPSIYEPDPVTRFIHVKQITLEERSGTKLSHTVAKWKLEGSGKFTGKEVKFGGGVRRLEYSAQADTGDNSEPVTFSLFIYIGAHGGDVEVNDPDAYSFPMRVPANSVKFGVRVRNWPFQQKGNRLGYQLSVEANDHIGQIDSSTSKDVLSLGKSGSMVFPRRVEVDGKEVDTTFNAAVFRGTDGGKKAMIDITLPAGKDVRYDPDVIVSGIDQSASDVLIMSQVGLPKEKTPHSDGTSEHSTSEHSTTSEHSPGQSCRILESRHVVAGHHHHLANQIDGDCSKTDYTWLYVVLGIVAVVCAVYFFNIKGGGSRPNADYEDEKCDESLWS